VVSNDDATHPPQMTNGIDEDHQQSDTASSESHPSNLTNGIHQSEALQSPTIKSSLDESHSDLLSKGISDLVNGMCSPTEHSKTTSLAADSTSLGMS